LRLVPPPPDPYSLSLRWLAVRELTELQLRQRLAARRISARSIDEEVRRLKIEGALDDRRSALAAARRAVLVKRHGRHRVAQELAALGIDREVAHGVVQEVFAEIDEPEMLEQALARRLGRTRRLVKDSVEYRKLYGYLVRQGFEPSAVANLLRNRARRSARPED
jgi:SOS response regulatory protein OraA/RecX